MHTDIIPGRECGSCNVCCVALTIDDTALQKAQGYRCKNAQRDNSCAIYTDRPKTCRDFNCGWRLLKWVKQPLRPDQSGVLVQLHGEISSDGSRHLGIAVTLLTKAALKADGLAETMAAAILAQVPVYLSIPGPPGYTSARARLNDALTESVLARDKPAILGILRHAHKQGSKGTFVPIALKPRAGDDPHDAGGP